MLYFVYPELALGYVLFSFLAALGVLQIVAAHHRLAGLCLLDRSRRRIAGYVLGVVLIVVGAVWYFVSQWWRILTPGPAGSELAVLISLSAGCALLFAAAMASFRQRRRVRPQAMPESTGKQTVNVGHAVGDLYLPSDPGVPTPAVTLVAGLGSNGRASMAAVAHELVQKGIAVLLLAVDRAAYTYPEVLALLPAAMSFLNQRPEVDPQRMGALGYDLGGDLVIRAASVDPQLKAVAALAPILGEEPTGLDLLREMSYPEAWRWAADRQRTGLRSELAALEYAPRIAPRPVLLLYGALDGLVRNPYTAPEDKNGTPPQPLQVCEDSMTIQTIAGAGHLDLLDHAETRSIVAQWFGERL